MITCPEGQEPWCATAYWLQESGQLFSLVWPALQSLSSICSSDFRE